MNPYDFVHMDWKHPVTRRTAAPNNVFVPGTLTGNLRGTITALRPIFLPDPKYKAHPQPFLISAGTQKPAIPASTLKGLFRSIAETAAPGCWRLFDGKYEKKTLDAVDYSDRLPKEYQSCYDTRRLCPTCRLFGMLGQHEALLGKVRFEDADCVEHKVHAAVYTPILAGPKPHHSAWYLENGLVTGRKFYFHQASAQFFREPSAPGSRKPLDHHITPLDEGSRFEFSASFENVAADEWPVLLYSLVLEPNMRHKVGNAKSAGFGSVEIRISRVELLDVKARYRGGEAGSQVLESADLDSYLTEQIAYCLRDAAPVTLSDLRRIWGWPPSKSVAYKYPDREWFTEHSTAPISTT